MNRIQNASISFIFPGFPHLEQRKYLMGVILLAANVAATFSVVILVVSFNVNNTIMFLSVLLMRALTAYVGYLLPEKRSDVKSMLVSSIMYVVPGVIVPMTVIFSLLTLMFLGLV